MNKSIQFLIISVLMMIGLQACEKDKIKISVLHLSILPLILTIISCLDSD